MGVFALFPALEEKLAGTLLFALGSGEGLTSRDLAGGQVLPCVRGSKNMNNCH